MTRKAGQICPSRRKLLLSAAGAAVLAGGGFLFGGRETARAQQKISKELAKYQDTPKDGNKCSECTFFEKPNACKAVEGDISPDGWCQLWTKAA
jgi:High potential iron-sulfur protein